MTGRCLADWIGDLVVLTPQERAALLALEERERPLRRGQVLLRENDRSTDLFVLRSGVMMSYALLDDGSRQIHRFLYPGELVGQSALAYAQSPYTVMALSDAVVCPFDRAAFTALAALHPRIMVAIVAMEQIERAALTDRLAALGRTSAKARVAAALLDIRDRLRRGAGTPDNSFAPGLTQEEIGDATGLTAVHVNRMLRQLEDEGLIARSHGRVTVLNEAALRRAGEYVDRFAGVDLSWLVSIQAV